MRSYDEFLISEVKSVSVPNNEKFVDKRKAGAAEIAQKAAAKGGYAELTAWHFKAKAPAYKEALKAIKKDEPIAFFESKFRELLSKLHSSMNQKQFQKLMGELEVWGEVMIQIKTGKEY